MIEEALANAGLEVSQVDWLLLHQANIRIMDVVADRLGKLTHPPTHPPTYSNKKALFSSTQPLAHSSSFEPPALPLPSRQ